MNAIRLLVVDAAVGKVRANAARVQVRELKSGKRFGPRWVDVHQSAQHPKTHLGDFADGRYLVRAELSDGDILEDTVEINGQPHELVLEALPEEGSLFSHELQRPPILFRVDAVAGDDLQAPPIPFRGASIGSNDLQVLSAPLRGDSIADSEGLTATPSRIKSFVEEVSTGSLLEALSGELRFRRDTGPMGLNAIVVPGRQSTWGIVVPCSWPGGTLTLNVDGSDGAGPELHLDDPDFSTLAAWLTRGRLDVANDFLRSRSLDALFEKVSNPPRAALGAYVLNAVAPEERQWVNNLAENFEWLPDGALAAAQMLSSAEPVKARGFLNRAYERGVPLFSHGMQKMLQLYYELDDGSTEHNQRLRSVRNLLARMRTDRLFTSVRLQEGRSGERY